jgi:type IV secretion system protein VirD4
MADHRHRGRAGDARTLEVPDGRPPEVVRDTVCLALLSDPTRTIESALTTMLKTVHDPARQYGWVDGVGHPSRTHPPVSGAARALLNKSDNERSSVVSSAVKFLNLYRDPVVARNTATSDFAVKDLMHHERPVSLYLTIPPSDIYRTRPLLRLLLQQIVSRLTETMDFAEGRPGHPYRNPVLLMFARPLPSAHQPGPFANEAPAC